MNPRDVTWRYFEVVVVVEGVKCDVILPDIFRLANLLIYQPKDMAWRYLVHCHHCSYQVWHRHHFNNTCSRGGSLKRLLNVHLGSFVTFLIFCQLLPGSPQQQHHAGDSQEEVDIFHRRGEGWFWIWWQIKRIKMERKKFKRYIPYLQHRGPQEVGTR